MPVHRATGVLETDEVVFFSFNAQAVEVSRARAASAWRVPVSPADAMA